MSRGERLVILAVSALPVTTLEMYQVPGMHRCLVCTGTWYALDVTFRSAVPGY